MEIRRPVTALLAALALFGGAATLTACGDPAGLDRNDGTSDDSTSNTSGNNPSGDSQGNLPDNSDKTGGTDQSGAGSGSG
jgi:hypothetical protein